MYIIFTVAAEEKPPRASERMRINQKPRNKIRYLFLPDKVNRVAGTKIYKLGENKKPAINQMARISMY